MVLYVGNPGLKIDHIKAKSANEEFRFTSDISKNESFIKYEKIPNDLKNPFPAKLIFYDKNNIEIPLVYYRKLRDGSYSLRRRIAFSC